MSEVKRSWRRGRTRISRKHQATIPVEVLRQAGLQAGDELVVVATGAGQIAMVRAEDVVALHAGKGAGDYGPDYLQALRDEWR